MMRKLKYLLAAVLALLLAAAPCALAEAYNTNLSLFPNKLVGYAAENTTAIYSAPTEFSAQIAVGRGFPLFVVGSAGQFYIVENAAGARGYALKRCVTSKLPAGANPFTGGYDPGWDRTSCMILLPAGMTVRATPYANAATITLDADTPCWVLPQAFATTTGKRADFYAVQNASNGVVAYFYPSDLVPEIQWHT